MEKPSSFLKAMIETFRLPNESLADFRSEYGKLTEDDKTFFRERFMIEYGWTWSA